MAVSLLSKQTKKNWWIDFTLFGSAPIAVLSGVYFLFLPSGGFRGGLKMGKVDFGGVIKEACLAYVPEAKVGDYCIIHVGFALSILNEAEAITSLETLREIAEMDKLLGSDG